MPNKKKKKEKKIPVLLLEDIANLGQKGEVVLVKPGYYRYLKSLNKVTLASKEKLSKELKPFLLTEKIKKREKELNELKEQIESLVLNFKINQYYKNITKEKIFKALKENNINISKNQIQLDQKLDKEGEFIVKINLGFDIIASLKIKIVKI
jgi:large subunit ribosomal protein L9